jgi:hypothetical protein
MVLRGPSGDLLTFVALSNANRFGSFLQSRTVEIGANDWRRK